jgi:16S rRNA (cytosine1402-N4)-methyltransferase
MMAQPGGRGGPGTGVRIRHIPVLLADVLAALQPTAGARLIDGTFGAGGYTRALLEAADCQVLAIERDRQAYLAGEALRNAFEGRLTLACTRFSGMEAEAKASGYTAVDGVVLDLGVSSMQLDDPARGFSFRSEGPLDMRMEEEGPSAATIVNGATESALADILYQLGEERRSRAIARAIVKAREQAPITTTKELAGLVERTLGRTRHDDKHPATRTFQALRIYVNDELGELAHGLAAAERLLKPGGRLVVVAFHSLEDRIIKRFLAARGGKAASASRHLPDAGSESRRPSFRIINRRPLTTSQAEAAANPRARSARLRAAERTDAPAWPLEHLAELGVPTM